MPSKQLSARELEILARATNSPTADDILENPYAAQELNEEIEQNFDQEVARKFAAEDPTLQGATQQLGEDIPVEPQEDDVSNELDTLSELEKQIKAAKVAEQAEQATQPETEPESASKEMTPEEKLNQQIMDAFHKLPGRPSEKQIAVWKKQYGMHGVNLIALSEQDIYVYTHLTKGQWDRIQEVVNQAASTEAFAKKADSIAKEKVLQYTVLWPKLTTEFFYNSRAGTMDTLYNIVMYNSYFFPPEQAMRLTVSL
jgi:hypothetical protein